MARHTLTLGTIKGTPLRVAGQTPPAGLTAAQLAVIKAAADAEE